MSPASGSAAAQDWTRWLEFPAIDSPTLAASKLSALARFTSLCLAVEFWEAMTYWSQFPGFGWHRAKLVLALGCAAATWHAPWARGACAGAALLAASEVVLSFPEAANHHYLQLLVLGLLAWTNRLNPGEATALTGGLRWIGLLGLIHAGWQKLLHGHYLDGSFLAFAISRNDRFSSFFAWLAPAQEVERLQGLSFGLGAGPYRVDSALFQAIANLTWVAEIVLPLMLLFRQTRHLGLLLVLGYIIAIELGAREIFFGGLIVNLLLLFAPTDWNRKLLPAFVGLYLLALLSTLGVIPHWGFT